MKTKNIFILAVAILFNISAFAQINVVDNNYKLSSGYNETTEMEKIDIYKYLKTQDVWIKFEPYSNVVGEKIYVYEKPKQQPKQLPLPDTHDLGEKIERTKKLLISEYFNRKVKESLASQLNWYTAEKEKIIREWEIKNSKENEIDVGHNKYPYLNRKEGTLKAKSMLPGYYTIVSIILTEEDFNRHKEEAFAMKMEPTDTAYLNHYFNNIITGFPKSKKNTRKYIHT